MGAGAVGRVEGNLPRRILIFMPCAYFSNLSEYFDVEDKFQKLIDSHK
jgi:hypothetical protein